MEKRIVFGCIVALTLFPISFASANSWQNRMERYLVPCSGNSRTGQGE